MTQEIPSNGYVKYSDIKEEFFRLNLVAQENSDWFDVLKLKYKKVKKQNEEMVAMLVDIVDLYQNVIPGKHEKEIRELIQKVEGDNR